MQIYIILFLINIDYCINFDERPFLQWKNNYWKSSLYLIGHIDQSTTAAPWLTNTKYNIIQIETLNIDFNLVVKVGMEFFEGSRK